MEVLETDVLVVGGGLAALRAALEAAAVADVIIAVKGKLGRSGSSAMTTAGYAADVPPPGSSAPSDEDVRRHFEDTLAGGYHLNDPQLVDVLVRESYLRLSDLENYGAELLREADGSYAVSPSGDHSVARVVSPVNRIGIDFTIPLAAKAQALGARALESVAAVELLVEGGAVCGAVCLHMRTAQLIVVRARVTILATGGAGQLFEITSNPAGSTGDGFALALQAGAVMRDMEMIQFYPWRCIDPFNRSRMPFQPSTFVVGGKLYNSSNERFMVRFNPDGFEASTRDIGARGIYAEIKAGRGVGGGVRADLSELDEATFRKTNPKVWKALQKTDIDYRTYPFILTPEAHYVMGGVAIDVDGQSSVDGLLAAGEVAGGIQGANRLNSNALPETQVFGQRAGARAADVAGAHPLGTPSRERLAAWQARLANVREGRDTRLKDERRTLQEQAWLTLGIEREEAGLERGLRYVQGLAHRMEVFLPSTPQEAMDWVELRNMATFAQASYASALARTETRGAHVRTDHPEQDDLRWLKAVFTTYRGTTDIEVEIGPVASQLEVSR